RVSLSSGDKPIEATVKLAPEQVIRGRMIDLQGLPARGVKARVVRLQQAPKEGDNRMDAMMRLQDGVRLPDNLSSRDWPSWPAPVTTDDNGRFTLRGFGEGHEVDLLIDDDRFARQEVPLRGGKEARVALTAPQHALGRVVFADTGKPAAGVWLNASTFR